MAAVLRCSLLPVLVLIAAAAAGEPMDLGNSEPRWVTVRFEVSPPNRPLQTDVHYTRDLPAWLEPGALPGEVRVTVAGSLVEQHLLGGQHPVHGSFSDFVWTFDAESGHVRSATLSGVLRQRLRIGFSTFEVETPIRVVMDTASPAGYGRTQRLFGHRILGFCAPDHSSRCQAVQPTPYDRATGYVNALGPVAADAQLARVRSFSPLGEAVFSEAEPRLASEGTPPVSLAPPAAQLN
jgi:hypothetical protein